MLLSLEEMPEVLFLSLRSSGPVFLLQYVNIRPFCALLQTGAIAHIFFS